MPLFAFSVLTVVSIFRPIHHDVRKPLVNLIGIR